MVGQNVGQYKVLEPLARGGMGSLYRAVDEALGREVALKILDGDIDDDAARFRAEATCLARLSHPGIATVYELLEYHDRPVMAMELLQGRTLQDILDQVGVFTPDRAAAIGIEVLGALSHAHAAGIVHRDIKPSNLMLTSTGAIKIMDFGIARMDGTAHLTHVGFLMGSPAYMAPEQIEGRAVDARADLYAMGVVLYRLLSLQFPFKGDTPLAMVQSQVRDEPMPIQQIRPDLPDWTHEIITRALAKDPAQRFQSAREMSDALSRAIALTPATAAPVIDGATEAMAIPDFAALPAAATKTPPAAPQNSVPTTAPKTATKTARSSDRAFVQQRLGRWLGAAAAAAVIGGVMWFGMPGQEARIDAHSDQVSNLATPPSAPIETPAPLAPAAANPEPQKVALQDALPPKAVPKTSGAKPLGRRGSAPVTAPPVTAPVAPVSYTSVKLMKFANDQASTLDVVLQFHDGELVAFLPGGADPITRVSYSGIASATYVYAKEPQWNDAASAPRKRVNVPGIVLRKRHWLVLQTQNSYAILQLDNENWSDVLKTFETRTGVSVGRPVDPAKPPQAGLPNR